MAAVLPTVACPVIVRPSLPIAGLDAKLIHYVDDAVSPENCMLLAWPPPPLV